MILSLFTAILACTDFVVPSAHNVMMSGRTMDFNTYFDSQIVTVPKRTEMQSRTPSGDKGMSWSNKYGFVGINLFKKPYFADGLNEAGLSCASLWLPGTEYAEFDPHTSKMAINSIDVVPWVLANFSSVEQVKEEIKNVQIYGDVLKPLGGIPTLHWAIHDASGESIVIECTQGKVHVYDNENQVLTNYPNFPWQLTNLTNYTALSDENAPIKVEGQTINGSGFLGIPGDMTPPSRFVRMSALRHFSPESKDADQAFEQASHLLGSVDVPHGEISEGDYTQWSLVRDHKNRILYIRSYKNTTPRKIDLTKLKWGKPKAVSVDWGPPSIDLTTDFS